jgi:hypothetical protein
MPTKKILSYFGWVILIILALIAFVFVRAWKNGFGYGAGSGVGSLVDVADKKYKCEYLQQYVDTFFSIYPQYKLPSGNSAESMIDGDNFMHLTSIYFDSYPRQTYFVQWCGTGFVSVRKAYDNQKREVIIENLREGVVVTDSVKEMMKKRFETEVLAKIDSIISTSKDSANAISKFSLE